MLRRVCIFCGSSTGARPEYRAAAEEVAFQLAKRNVGIVFGGGCVGLMGVVADAALAQGAHVIGVIPSAMVARELAHRGLPDLRVVASMHERKALMANLSDAFIALPGGFGTFEEFCEVVTWTQLGLHRKPCGLLNVAGYYDPLGLSPMASSGRKTVGSWWRTRTRWHSSSGWSNGPPWPQREASGRRTRETGLF